MFNKLFRVWNRSRSNVEQADARIKSTSNYNRAASGVVVSEDAANSVSAAWCAAKAISEDIAGLPWNITREGADGTTTITNNHDVFRLLNRKPNSMMTSAVFREVMIRSALLRGNGFAEIERSLGGQPIALWPIHPDNVEYALNKDTGEYFWLVRTRAREVAIPLDDMFHLMGPSPDGKVGYSVITMARHSLGLTLAAEQFGSEFFANGAHLSGVLKHPTVLGDEAYNRLVESWRQMHTGGGNRLRFALLEAGTEWQPLSVAPDDAQFLQTRQFQIGEIARWFRVPPHKLMDLQQSSLSNITSMSRAYVQDSLVPWVTKLEQEADSKLLRQPSLRTNIDVTALLRGDAQERAQYYRELWGMGVITINEIRRMEGFNPIGTEGDTRIVQKQWVTLESVVNGETLDRQNGSIPNDEEENGTEV